MCTQEKSNTVINDEFQSSFKLFIKAFTTNKGAILGLIFIIFLLILALFGQYIAPHDPIEQFRNFVLLPPFWDQEGNSTFLLGTDDLGRDILSRLIVGTKYSILNGFMIVSISMIIGVILGLIAGYFGGVIDFLITRLVDIILALPSLLVAIAVVAILGPSLINAAIAVGFISIPAYVRLTRIQVKIEKSKDYVIASRLAGAGIPRLMFNAILPNTLAPVAVQATLGFSTAILTMSALGFLGLGVQPPAPEWGTMLSQSTKYLLTAPWTVTFPGLAILLTVLSFNFMGDGIRDALDPKLRQQS